MQSVPPRSFARAPAPAPRPVGFSSRFVIGLGILTLAAILWGGAATWYILFRDDFVQTFLARQAEMRFAYEDRVTELKNRLEREITSGLVERKGFGGRVDALVKRQAEIEARQTWLAALAERIGGGSTPGPSSPSDMPARLSGQAVPSLAPEPNVVTPAVPSLSAKPSPVPVEPFDLRLREHGEAPAPRAVDRLSALEDSLRRASDGALAATDALRRTVRDRSLLVRQAMAGTRVSLPTGSVNQTATGGPFIPAPEALDATAFAPLAEDAERHVADLERVMAAAHSLPVGRPLAGDLEPTSGFGYRVDPFNRGAALHSGIDFRVMHGAPVRATAAGRVVTADYSGGYGNMVEVEHASGVSTRYGHLSAISVAPGQRIEAGQVVGRAGSTGRSTGTHLHYETRIDGEAVNPTRFLEAGRLLATLR